MAAVLGDDDAFGLGVGDGDALGLGVGDGDALGLGVGDGDALGLGVGDGDALGLGVGDAGSLGLGVGDAGALAQPATMTANSSLTTWIMTALLRCPTCSTRDGAESIRTSGRVAPGSAIYTQ
jgi:hypothetical protein